MDASQLVELVKKYEENRAFISNEETAKVALVIPFIKLLGYDPSSPREVRLEYCAEFTQGDGKRLPDRMDFAIFDKTGVKPLMVIETKPLGTDLLSRSQQLARYLAQMPDLRFGMITDGCHYYFFGDLDSPNQMDREPFFYFTLDDPKTDWSKVAKFLSKFSRDTFNADTLITDAENARYRQAMIEKLAAALRSPADDEDFLKWLTEDVYKSKRTTGVMARLGEVAKDAVEPALLRVMGNDFLNKLQEKISKINEPPDANNQAVLQPSSVPAASTSENGDERAKKGLETTPEELELHVVVQRICEKHGIPASDILHRDTVNYLNISFLRPTKWFIRFFGDAKRKNITTLVPLAEAKQLAPGFEVEEAPPVFGASRVYIDSVAQLWALSALIVRSLQILKSGREEGQEHDVMQ